MSKRLFLAINLTLSFILVALYMFNAPNIGINASISYNVMGEQHKYKINNSSDIYSKSSISSVISSYRTLIVAVEFPDKLKSTSLDYIEAMWHDVIKYYHVVSYGKFSLENYTLYSKWVLLPRDMNYYGRDEDDREDVNIEKLIEDTIDIIDPYVNFKEYDRLYIIHAGDNQARSGISNDIWSKAIVNASFYTEDMVSVNAVAIVSEFDPLGVYVHEYGHLISVEPFGYLPDLYDIHGITEYVGFWSVMAIGSWAGDPPGSSPTGFTVPEKYWCNWVSNAIVEIPPDTYGKYVIHRLEDWGDTLGLRILISKTVYYFIEYRYKTGIDLYIPANGILLTLVNESRGSGEGIITVIDKVPSTPSKNDAIFLPGDLWLNTDHNIYMEVLDMNVTHAIVNIQYGITNLKIGGIWVKGDHKIGHEHEIIVEVINDGNLNISVPVALNISINGESYIKYINNIDPQSSVNISITFIPEIGGNYTIKAIVDYYDNVVEDVEFDNSYSQLIQIFEYDFVYIVEKTEIDGRIDVYSIVTIGFRIMWSNGTYVKPGFKVYINDTICFSDEDGWVFLNITSDKVGLEKYMVTRVDPVAPGYVDKVGPIKIIWDMVIIMFKKPYLEVYEGEVIKLEWDAYYASDNSTANVTIIFNMDPANLVFPGHYKIMPVQIMDRIYGISMFKSIPKEVVIFIRDIELTFMGEIILINIDPYTKMVLTITPLQHRFMIILGSEIDPADVRIKIDGDKVDIINHEVVLIIRHYLPIYRMHYEVRIGGNLISYGYIISINILTILTTLFIIIFMRFIIKKT